MTEQKFRIAAVDADNAVYVGKVFRSTYGDDFPVKDVYQPQVLAREIQAGRLAASLAFDEAGQPAGYVSVFKNAPNPRLWEGGNLIVDPAYRFSDLSTRLFGHYLAASDNGLSQSDGLYSEAVCYHYFTQIGCAKAGMADCALELDQLDAASFKDGKAGTGRVSCVLNFLEWSDPSVAEHLPARYAEMLGRIARPLRPRSFLPAKAPLPAYGLTASEAQYHPSARTWKVFVREIGADWQAVLGQIMAEAAARRVVSLQLTINTASPCIDAAIELMRRQGFFFGGLAPRWFGSDGVLMQKLLAAAPDFAGIKLYTAMAKELLAYIKADREAVVRLQSADNGCAPL